ncbi:MAG: chromate transporter [Verrucomicrobiota bacterium]|jgi:chromate transporter
MRELVSLLNVFCLLSLLAVGGGSAVLPQMEHETVTVHKWVTADDFATIYSLGQMAPGPNMTMVGLIGFKAANHSGMSNAWALAAMLVVLFAFYLPSSFLTYAVSHIWDSFKENPWRDSVQKGMAPITIGLMLAGVHAVGKTASYNPAHSFHFNSLTISIGLAVTVWLFLNRTNPALLILLGGVVGWFFLRGI